MRNGVRLKVMCCAHTRFLCLNAGFWCLQGFSFHHNFSIIIPKSRMLLKTHMKAKHSFRTDTVHSVPVHCAWETGGLKRCFLGTQNSEYHLRFAVSSLFLFCGTTESFCIAECFWFSDNTEWTWKSNTKVTNLHCGVSTPISMDMRAICGIHYGTHDARFGVLQALGGAAFGKRTRKLLTPANVRVHLYEGVDHRSDSLKIRSNIELSTLHISTHFTTIV